jgi:hypothetical protein
MRCASEPMNFQSCWRAPSPETCSCTDRPHPSRSKCWPLPARPSCDRSLRPSPPTPTSTRPRLPRRGPAARCRRVVPGVRGASPAHVAESALGRRPRGHSARWRRRSRADVTVRKQERHITHVLPAGLEPTHRNGCGQRDNDVVNGHTGRHPTLSRTTSTAAPAAARVRVRAGRGRLPRR